MSQILTNRIKNHIDTSVIEHIYTDDCKDDKANQYSRGLVAIYIASAFGLKYNEIPQFITDGSRDNGIDGAYYDKNQNKLHIIQSKWSTSGTGTIGTGDIHKFIQGTYKILNSEWKSFNKRMKTIAQTLESGIKNDPEIILIACFNSEGDLSAECKEIVDDFLDKNNSDENELVTFKTFNLKGIARAIAANKTGKRTDIEINLLQWGEQKEPAYSIYGKVSCADIAAWHKTHEDSLFSENIRSALGDSEINQQIEASLTSEPELFWYLNNGITAIADSITRRPVGLGDQKESSNWNIGNIKIVNGAQTTSTIAKVEKKNPSAAQKAFVQIKIISLERAPINMAQQITTATNTQNRVEARDFLTLNPDQESLAESFRKIGIRYIYRRGESTTNPQTDIDIQELALALAVSSDEIPHVATAKGKAGHLTDPQKLYPKLFTPLPEASKALEIVKRWRNAASATSEFLLNQNERDAQIATHGNRFMEHILVKSKKKTFTQKTIAELHSNLKATITELYPESYLSTIFKNASKCAAIKQKLNSIN